MVLGPGSRPGELTAERPFVPNFGGDDTANDRGMLARVAAAGAIIFLRAAPMSDSLITIGVLCINSRKPEQPAKTK